MNDVRLCGTRGLLDLARAVGDLVLGLREDPFITSVEVAFMRALGVRDPTVRGPDILAHRFLTPKFRAYLLLGPVARWISERVSPGCYGYHNARTKHFDSTMEAEVANGIEQLVILGAGNDSRAYRMPYLKDIRVFEVDLPRTQARKRRVVRRLLGSLPSHVTFLPLDFESDALEERLLSVGFDRSRRTMFSWEGVSMYLTEQAVDGVLKCIAGLNDAAGTLIFDYSLRSYTEARDRTTYGGEQLAKWLADRGMEYRFGAQPEEMRSMVAARGFELISDVGPAELESCLQVAGEPSWRVWGNFRILYARFPGR